MSSDYGVLPKHYLARARKLIKRQNKESLFHAAFELRACVEARQDQYLQAQKRYVRSIPRSWNIGAQGTALRAVFGDTRIQRISLDNGSFGIFAVYVPVTKELRSSAEKLGELLHAQSQFRHSDDHWWQDVRSRLSKISERAEYCCRGDLLCPAMIVGGNAIGELVLDVTETSATIAEHFPAGRHVQMRVDYLDNWTIDLPPLLHS